tara:strand:- start:237 stop:509 length:273 start_codon:yes stop_codon:yes gene_type:complete
MSEIKPRCEDDKCSHYGKEYAKTYTADMMCIGHDISATSIAKDIVALTERLDTQEELKDSWRIINLALNYLSSKDSMFTYEKEVKEKIGE